MWVSLLLGLLSFIMSKKSGASGTKALATAALVGAGSYYVATETDWGKANLTFLDTPTTTSPTATPVLDSNGKPVVSAGGVGLTTSIVGGATDVLKSWGGLGTAAVIGTAGVAGSGLLKNPWVLAALAAGAFLLLSK